jgi:predicted lactoylglutathione lyase
MANSYPIKIWSGLLYNGHIQKIENALWEFIWLINKVTKEEGE